MLRGLKKEKQLTPVMLRGKSFGDKEIGRIIIGMTVTGGYELQVRP
jgi:hypothetical protein